MHPLRSGSERDHLHRLHPPRSPVKQIESLLRQVRRKQVLLCAYQPEDDPAARTPTLAELSAVLQVTAGECLSLAHRLQAKGILEPAPDHPPGHVRLTEKGRRLAARMLTGRSSVPTGVP